LSLLPLRPHRPARTSPCTACHRARSAPSAAVCACARSAASRSAATRVSSRAARPAQPRPPPPHPASTPASPAPASSAPPTPPRPRQATRSPSTSTGPSSSAPSAATRSTTPISTRSSSSRSRPHSSARLPSPDFRYGARPILPYWFILSLTFTFCLLLYRCSKFRNYQKQDLVLPPGQVRFLHISYACFLLLPNPKFNKIILSLCLFSANSIGASTKFEEDGDLISQTKGGLSHLVRDLCHPSSACSSAFNTASEVRILTNGPLLLAVVPPAGSMDCFCTRRQPQTARGTARRARVVLAGGVGDGGKGARSVAGGREMHASRMPC
jgi:hypothetical protein